VRAKQTRKGVFASGKQAGEWGRAPNRRLAVLVPSDRGARRGESRYASRAPPGKSITRNFHAEERPRYPSEKATERTSLERGSFIQDVLRGEWDIE